MTNAELLKKLENKAKIGSLDMTVAELAARLAGLPPMMDVFVNADGVSMFLNDVQIEQIPPPADEAVPGYQAPPFLRLVCSETPVAPKPPSTESVEEQTARQAQRSMDLARNIQQAEQMPPGLHHEQ
jgi:hypothetical protein